MIHDKTSVHQETIDWFRQLTFSKISRSLHGQTLTPFTALCKIIWKLRPFSSQSFFESFSQSYVTKLPAILVTNRWNRHRFSRIFWNNHEISTSHCFPPWNVPSPSPMLSHAYFEALRPLWYPNQHWGRGNRHKCFKIFDEYCI